MRTNAQAAEASTAPTAFNSDEWRSFKVVSKRNVSSNTVFLRFAFPDESYTAGLPVASCLMVRAPLGEEKEDGTKEFVARPYTPISPPDSMGHFDLMVKSYPNGTMSKHLGEISEGDSVECKGPIVKLPYEKLKKQIGMIAGGTGLTPMLQVVEEILRHEDDKEVSFVFANQSPDDILMKDRLDELAAKHSNFKVHYVVDKADDSWKGDTGYITADIIDAHLPSPSQDTLMLVCGPPPMMKAISGDKNPDKSQGELTGTLAKMGYNSDMVYKF